MRSSEGDKTDQAALMGAAVAAVAGLCAGLALADPMQLLSKLPPCTSARKLDATWNLSRSGRSWCPMASSR
jgi:hypothetical protein